jgi:tRNA modification GTPase
MPDGFGSSSACLLTPPGRSALAVVGVRGPQAMSAVSASFQPRGDSPLHARADRAVVFGRWGGPQGEELIVVRRAADNLEVHCHGGIAAAAAILRDLARAGCRQIDISAWASDASRNGVDAAGDEAERERRLIVAEAQLALAFARGPHAARLLAHQLSGSLAAAIDTLRAAESPQREALAERLLSWRGLGLRLTRPWRVVVAGPPNAGKSSLVNALAGFARSIVSPTAGTTRDVLETRLVLGGWDLVLIDTAGLRLEAGDSIEEAGIAKAVAATSQADLVVVVTASDQPDTTAAGTMLCPHAPRLFVTNKSDLLTIPPAAAPPSLHTSALTGAGIEDLASRIIHTLIPQTPPPAEPIPFTPRQIDLIHQLRGNTAHGWSGSTGGKGRVAGPG